MKSKRLYKEDLLKMDRQFVVVYNEDYGINGEQYRVNLTYRDGDDVFGALADMEGVYLKIDNDVEFGTGTEVYEFIGTNLMGDDQASKEINIMENLINCTIENEGIILPKYESVCASGMDLRAYKFALPSNLKETLEFPYTLKPLERILVKTGLHIELPKNTEAQIRPRSGLALKNGISIVNSPGTIDEDYRGDVGVVLINLSSENFLINQGDRIAQMVFAKVEKFDLEIVPELSSTIRGAGGFNSTGTK